MMRALVPARVGQAWVLLDAEIVKQIVRFEPGHVYLATDDEHLVALSDKQLATDRGPAVEGHRPAATALFQSLAARLGARSCGVILSGMGRDGVAGLLKMKARGALTLGQQEDGCAVYGMPGAALEAGALVAALDPAALAREVSAWPAAFYLAVCHEALGQLEEATREYRHVVRVASRAVAPFLPRRHSAWHGDLLELARTRAVDA